LPPFFHSRQAKATKPRPKAAAAIANSPPPSPASGYDGMSAKRRTVYRKIYHAVELMLSTPGSGGTPACW
jgi:hypothetical protein